MIAGGDDTGYVEGRVGYLKASDLADPDVTLHLALA